jgi:hypothetical protein
MPTPPTKRYCADPQALSAMKRDGLGWGHDLDCGCFHDTAHPSKPNFALRLLSVFKRKS